MAKVEFEDDLVLSITMQLKDILIATMEKRGMMDKKGDFRLEDFVYIMSHIEKSFNRFDIAMEAVYNFVKDNPNHSMRTH